MFDIGDLVYYKYPDRAYDGMGFEYVSGIGMILSKKSEYGIWAYKVHWFDRQPTIVFCLERELVLVKDVVEKSQTRD